ncbi:MAG: DNA-directed RNA polymerase subunit alpha [Phycisphaerae bacterium]|jgi:DNA-directed RNA polymerase subunit alpha
MRITWRGIELPTRFELDEQTATSKYGKFIVEPFERGFGTTIGNSLRRILLSSIEGAAVTRIRVSGVDHEFSSIEGVLEDVTDIIINIKKLIVKLDGSVSRTIKVCGSKKGVVTAGMIEPNPYVEIVDPDHVLFTLTQDKKVEIEMTVEKGRGYIAVKDRVADSDRFEQEHGIIEIDAIYAPIDRVRYKTEDTRVGQRTNYDKLILEIWTDGTVTPELALVEAAKILRKHVNPFTNFLCSGDFVVDEELMVREIERQSESEELRRKLDMNVRDLELSVRANNCLESIKLNTVRELVAMQESDLLKVRSFGKTSLREINRKLEELGLHLGMSL